MRIYFIIAFILSVSVLFAQQKPNTFVEETNPSDANFEVYSQKDDLTRRSTLYNLRKYFGGQVNAVPITYTPAATGNLSNQNEFVTDPAGDIWFIDGTGDAILLKSASGGGSGHVPVTVINGQTIDMISSGVDNQTISGEILASPDAGNALELRANGVFVQTVTGGGIQVYQSGDAMIKATDTGITFSKAAGVGTFTIPAGVEMLSARVNGTTGDLSSNNFKIRLDYGGATYNTSITNYFPPGIQVLNTAAQLGGGPSDTLPFVMDEGADPQVQITAVGTGDVDAKVINLNAFTNWTIIISL